jgi:hypothetical protein
MTDRSREAAEFISTVDDVPPQAVSACEGWTTHEIAAHVTGIAVEVIQHLEPFLQGDPVPKTRSFEEREAPLQAMEHAALFISAKPSSTTSATSTPSAACTDASSYGASSSNGASPPPSSDKALGMLSDHRGPDGNHG